MKITLDTEVKSLYSVGETTYKRLEKLGLNTVSDLLFYYPFRYEDYSTVTPIAELEVDQQTTIEATIELIENKRAFRAKKFITQAIVSDDSGSMKLVWFNQRYLTKVLEQGMKVRFAGKVTKAYEGNGVQMTNPVHEVPSGDSTHTGRLAPVYSVTSNLTQKQIRFLTKKALEAIYDIEDYLPEQIIDEEYLPLHEALSQIHFPDSQERAQLARERLKFDELFLLQIKITKAKQAFLEDKAKALDFPEEEIKQFVQSLPFELTPDQRRCAYQIMLDMQKEIPMNRLLEGDVGSGKTVVALLAAYYVFLNKGQSVFLAPTEILAKQHFAKLQTFLEGKDLNLGLCTRTRNAYVNSALDSGEMDISKEEMAQKCEKGTVDILVATHTVLQDQFKFENLNLVIVDEQHRFGVNQRKELRDRCRKQGIVPHFLSMTATPIPRSLALILYGDLSISLLKTKPKGRKRIETKVVYSSRKQQVMDFIKSEIQQGRQAFFVCPLIDMSDKLGVTSVKQAFKELSQKYFPDQTIEMLHGKLKTADKEKIMKKFQEKEIDILVSTAVVEVGVDIPNATVMGILGAERFGLASLHQFRGRVGRSDLQSYCFIFPDQVTDKSKQRLGFMETCFDGFDLAQKDLEMRGPGEMYGAKQSGLPEFRIASIFDHQIVERAQYWAQKVLDDGLSQYPALQNKIEVESDSLHLE